MQHPTERNYYDPNDDHWKELGWTKPEVKQYFTTRVACDRQIILAAHQGVCGKPTVGDDGFETVVGKGAMRAAREEKKWRESFKKEEEKRKKYSNRLRKPYENIGPNNVYDYAHEVNADVIHKVFKNQPDNATSSTHGHSPGHTSGRCGSYSTAAAAPAPTIARRVPADASAPGAYGSYAAAAAAPAPAIAPTVPADAPTHSLSPRKVHYFSAIKSGQQAKRIIYYMWTSIWTHELSRDQIKWMTDFIVNRAGRAGEGGILKGPYGTDLENAVFLQLEEAYNKCPGGVFVYEESKVIYT